MEFNSKPKLKRHKGKHSSFSSFTIDTTAKPISNLEFKKPISNLDFKKPFTIPEKQLNKDISDSVWRDDLKTKIILQLRLDPLKCEFKNGNVIDNMKEYMLNFSEYKKFNYLRKSIDPHFDWEMEGFCGQNSEIKILYQWNSEKKMCRKLFYPSKFNEKVKYEWQCCGLTSRCYKPHQEFFE